MHLTYFGASWNELTPEINFLTSTEWKAVTFENILNHPLGLIVVSIWMFVCALFIMLFDLVRRQLIYIPCLDEIAKIRNRPLIAESRDNVEKILVDKELKSKYHSVQVLPLFKNEKFKHLSRRSKFCICIKLVCVMIICGLVYVKETMAQITVSANVFQL